MSKTPTNKPEQLKVFNSSIYRKKIKKMVEMTKNIYGIHGKIPKGELPKLKESASSSQKSDRALKEAYRLKIDVLHYFATPIASHRTVEVAPTTDSQS